MKEYTKSGYHSASKHFHDGDLEVDCSGQHYMITGANSGIGKCIATEIAKRGGTIHMVCRNPKTAQEAKCEIINATDNQNVMVHILDMCDSRAVYNFAKNFCAENDVLHTLVNNAGCMINTRQLTTDGIVGIEKNFATNTLGTYILTTTLLPALEKTEKSRVVTVTSGGMLVQKLNINDLQFEKLDPFDGTMAYAQNKRQQVVMTEQWSKQHPGVHFSCMHPGWADTPAVRTSMPEFYEKMKDRLRSAEEGADTAVWLAISSAAVGLASGQFFQDRKEVSTHLPLAHTKVSHREEEGLMSALDNLVKKVTNL
ncbi:hypothetical protein Pmani_002332 [Petrolisthes manimaculis]|uniref:Dehydrogenase/reductase SDR family member 12 n=1 Tax=Petrolisthes manimaculis TaxID=1843537 RepID=A0AAE1UQK4_9EUCA|nr:hypothetical protein Pmani_002332 [Petrolisthes manimaculis]